VIDSPPVLSVTDAVVMGRMVDAVVLVVRHGKESKNVMRRAATFWPARALGGRLVLNAVDVNSPIITGTTDIWATRTGTLTRHLGDAAICGG